MKISTIRSRTGTSNAVGDAAKPKSIRKVTRPVSATVPPGRRPRIMIHLPKPKEPSSAISLSDALRLSRVAHCVRGPCPRSDRGYLRALPLYGRSDRPASAAAGPDGRTSSRARRTVRVKPSWLHGPARAESGRRPTCDWNSRLSIRIVPEPLTHRGVDLVSRPAAFANVSGGDHWQGQS